MMNYARILIAISLPLLAEQPEIHLTQVASGLTQPTDIQSPGDGSGRLFFVQQDGIIRIYKAGTLLPAPFLDIRSLTEVDNERGLVGLAFPPSFAQKRLLYINYTRRSDGATVVARYRVTSNPDVADPNSAEIVLTVAQPYPEHNGGQLRFGPDGYLYVGIGDGGAGGDPENRAQDRGQLLGKMIRIDVESDPAQYRIPPDNPFVSDPGSRPEIWSLGLRNPWRFSFDRESGDLWIADVGQNLFEEVNFQPAASRGGENYGWRLMEGLHCFMPSCDRTGLTLPVQEYSHDDGKSVTGGFVYRGSRFPALRGTYIYGDFNSGRIWGIRRPGDRFENRLLMESGLSISTFGEGEDGEVFVADYWSGLIYRVEGIAEDAAPYFTADSVVNAASFAPGVVAGSAASIFLSGVLPAPGIVAAGRAPLPLQLAGVQVAVDGLEAPLFAVANYNGIEQVNIQVPFEVADKGDEVSVVVTRNGVASDPVSVPLLRFQPGIFAKDGAAVAVHSDNTLVTSERPLAVGDFFYFYATGLGKVGNNPGSGNAGPEIPLASTPILPEVTLGGVACDVQFAGLAPGLVGVYQVNARIPSGLSGGVHPLVVSSGGLASLPASVPLL